MDAFRKDLGSYFSLPQTENTVHTQINYSKLSVRWVDGLSVNYNPQIAN